MCLTLLIRMWAGNNTAFHSAAQNTSVLRSTLRKKLGVVCLLWQNSEYNNSPPSRGRGAVSIPLNVYEHIESSEKCYKQKIKARVLQINIFEHATDSDLVDCLPNISFFTPCYRIWSMCRVPVEPTGTGLVPRPLLPLGAWLYDKVLACEK